MSHALSNDHVRTDAPLDEEGLQRRLAAFNRTRLLPSHDDIDWEMQLSNEYAHRRIEAKLFERERAHVAARAAQAPRDPEGFVRWFEALIHNGPGQGDPLFPWLRDHAPLASMRWFLRQEMAGEAGFDDLVALSQLRLPVRPKLEMARNYWDEMGQGHLGGMHGPLLSKLGEELSIQGPEDNSDIVCESLALGNLMVAMAMNRQCAYHSIGALGVIELTAPGRAEQVNLGLKRLGVAGAARRYFALHATLDKQHSAAWNSEVLIPLVREDPAAAPALAEGALIRLIAGQRCFERYRKELELTPRVVRN